MRLTTIRLLALVLLALPLGTACADEASDAHKAGIEAMYPVLLAHRDAGRTDAARELVAKAIKWQPSEPRHRVTLATIESVAGRTDAALSALESAAELGYTDAATLTAEPTLASLRSSDRFTALIEKLAGKTATDPKATKPAPAAAPTGPEVLPVEAKLTDNGPVGAYFQTKVIHGSSTLEKSVWYFKPDGTVHFYVTLGYSDAELASDDKSSRGTVRRDGDQIEITWKDGSIRRARYEPKADGTFWWDMGLFTRVKPLDRAAALGTWEFHGTRGVSTEDKGNANTSSQTKRFTFSPDGTFVHTGVLIVTVDENPDVTSTGKKETRGQWTARRYSLVLSGADDSEAHGIAFTIDDAGTPEPSDWLYYRGMMHRRVKP